MQDIPWWYPKRFKQEAIAFDIAERKWVAEQKYKFWTQTWPAQQWKQFHKESVYVKLAKTD